jgi:hypothetical protein
LLSFFHATGKQKRKAAVKCRECLFDNPSDAGLPKIADAKKRLATL